jgi:hypothetical protein
MKEKFNEAIFMNTIFFDFQYQSISKIYNYMKNKNYEVYFINNEDENKIKSICETAKDNLSQNYFLYFETDNNSPICDIPDNVILYRTSNSNDTIHKNERILPVLYVQNPEYNINNNNILPIKKRDKPFISFCGYIMSNKKRLTELEYLKKNNLLNCNFIYKKTFRGGTRNELIENMKNSEFCFCPVGNGNFSIRFYECLFIGRIPIILIDHQLPFTKFIDWKNFIVIANTIEELPEKINNFWKENNIYEKQIECKKLFEKYFNIDNCLEYLYKNIL